MYLRFWIQYLLDCNQIILHLTSDVVLQDEWKVYQLTHCTALFVKKKRNFKIDEKKSFEDLCKMTF